MVVCSDIHLGSSHCKIKEFIRFLEGLHTDKLVLVGDIIDIQEMRANNFKHIKHDFRRACALICELSKTIEVHYIRGNHEVDGSVTGYLRDGKVIFHESYYIDSNILFIHGHDTHTKRSYKDRFLYLLYDLFNGACPQVITWAKTNGVCREYVINFRTKQLLKLLEVPTCDTVVCGHIHVPEVYKQDRLTYVNTGDWVSSLSYIEIKDKEINLCYEKA